MSEPQATSTVPVPIGLLAQLADEYLRGNCPIKGGWGDSTTIERLISLIPAVNAVSAWLPEETWEVTIGVGTNVISGPMVREDRKRIIDAVATALTEINA